MEKLDFDVEFKVEGKEKIPDEIEWFITAVPENGFSGVLALRQLVEDLDMELVGYAASDVTKTLFRIEDGKPRPSVPIYVKDSILVLLFEIPTTNSMVLPMGHLVDQLTRDRKIANLVMLSSAPSNTRKDKDYEEIRTLGTFIGENYGQIAKDLNLDVVDNATLSGPFAWVMNNRMMDKEGALVILSETYPYPMVDPGSGAKLLEVLGQMLNKQDQLNISKLLEEAHEAKSKLKKLQQAAQKAQKQQTPSIADFYT